MNSIKVNLTIYVPGAKMVSEQECSKNSKNKKNAFDRTKYDVNFLKLRFEENGKFKSETISFLTRKSIPALQNINITDEAYKYYISSEVPPSFPKEKGKFIWTQMSKKQRLQYHLEDIANALGGKIKSFVVFED